MLLEAFGHDVRVALNGRAALEIAREFRPDVVLLDLAMPLMSGYEVAAQLLKILDSDRVTIVALTGYGRDADIQRTKDAGFRDHLVKPVDPDKLAAVLASHCPTPPSHEA